MTKPMQYQMEVAGETATLYVTGSLDHDDVEALTSVCAAAPLGTRTLRLDLHGLGQLSADGIGAVRGLLRFWRDSRHGEIRPATSHMLVPRHTVARTRVSAPPEWRTSFVNDALVGTYL